MLLSHSANFGIFSIENLPGVNLEITLLGSHSLSQGRFTVLSPFFLFLFLT